MRRRRRPAQSSPLRCEGRRDVLRRPRPRAPQARHHPLSSRPALNRRRWFGPLTRPQDQPVRLDARVRETAHELIDERPLAAGESGVPRVTPQTHPATVLAAVRDASFGRAAMLVIVTKAATTLVRALGAVSTGTAA